ncbi:nuclease-like protein (plasmid) [Peptoclostridium acidaminophilum DSM 3953]|uniref:Nuclease-like protein n=1 Tax=Peptoclostridium acidaminophilum DSM 3953 TaxID=1286171 RepID=W8UA57_PEPAC|nr:nuclease-related domain-containing protein [Peptoclostridium acidaminophilum]AHM57681.1 nuclease-like protein [Peptoclostridium acidaminophilum DSM 3953]
MPAKLAQQDKEVRKLFYEKINAKVQEEKNEMNERIEKKVAPIFAKIIKPIAGVVFDVNRIKQNEKGENGEISAENGLFCLLSSDHVLMSDIVLEVEPDEFIQLDHLVISKAGIFIIETKKWGGAYKAYRDKWYVKKDTGWEPCKSPTMQNKRHHKLLKKWMQQNIGENAFVENNMYPLIIFYSSWLRTNECSMPIFESSINASFHIKSFKENVISEELISEIVNKIKYAKPLNYQEWEEKTTPKYTIEEGKTRYGKSFVRVTGSMEDAVSVADDYSRQGFKVSEVKADKKDEQVKYFYISKMENTE